MRGIVQYFGLKEKSYPCGYCKITNPDNASYGFWAHKLSTLQYQDLIDRAWRRSGQFCYKSKMDKTCCPPFAIRCDALQFKPTRSQRKIIKRFNDFINYGIVPKSCDKDKSNKRLFPSKSVSCKDNQHHQVNLNEIKQETRCSESLDGSKSSDKQVKRVKEFPSGDVNMELPENLHKNGTKDKSRKAKYLRIKRRIEKVKAQHSCSEEDAYKLLKEKRAAKLKRRVKSYEDYFTTNENQAHKFEINFVSTSNEDFEETFDDTFKLYKKYQLRIHNDEPSECTPKQFKRFLVDNPFQLEPFSDKSMVLPTAYGSYQMQYWLDGKLIAVGVIDILPRSVSSVYLFYDPDYSFLSLGTYAALNEILLVRSLNKINPQITHYYLGLYIHSCSKMSYKGNFYPSYLLCDQALTWHPIEKCLPKLEKHPYPRLEDNLNIHDEDALVQDEDILILYSHMALNYRQYKLINGNKDEDGEVYEYARLIGKKCSKSILLYRSD